MKALVNLVLPVVAASVLLAVFIGGDHLSSARSGATTDTGMRRSTYNENELQTLLTQEYNPFADGLSSAMIKLGHARNELLRTAACNMDDSSSLREAGVAYRSSILEFREAIAILRQNVGPDVANQIVGEQMQQAMPFSQRMLLAEISGDLNPIQPEE